jgi:hypothetical protein
MPYSDSIRESRFGFIARHCNGQLVLTVLGRKEANLSVKGRF